MIEKSEIRKRLIKSTLFTLAIFIVIFLILDVITYQRISYILYEEIDQEILGAMDNCKLALREKNFAEAIKKIKANPRLIYIIRDSSRECIKWREYWKDL